MRIYRLVAACTNDILSNFEFVCKKFEARRMRKLTRCDSLLELSQVTISEKANIISLSVASDIILLIYYKFITRDHVIYHKFFFPIHDT